MQIVTSVLTSALVAAVLASLVNHYFFNKRAEKQLKRDAIKQFIDAGIWKPSAEYRRLLVWINVAFSGNKSIEDQIQHLMDREQFEIADRNDHQYPFDELAFASANGDLLKFMCKDVGASEKASTKLFENTFL